MEHSIPSTTKSVKGRGRKNPQGRNEAAVRQKEEELRQASEQLQAALRVSSLGTWRWDLERNLVGIDDAMREVLGMAPLDAPIPPEQFVRLMHPDDQPRMAAYVAQVQRERRQVDVEFRILYPGGKSDGEVRWLLSRGSPVIGHENSVSAILGAAVDITERKQAEEALARMSAESDRWRRLYETVLANTPDLGYVFDLNHRFTFANQALLTMWGKTWDEAIGKNCLELGYEPWHAAMHDREIERVVATKQPVRGEVPFTGTHGRRIYDYIFFPVIGVNGEVEAVAGSTRDITDRNRAEDALRESELRYRNLFESMDEGYCIIEMIFDRPGAEQAVDYRFVEVNPAFEAQAGMRDVTGKRMLEFVPSIEEHWLANYSKVALTGQPVRFANEYKTLHRWFDVYAFRVGQPEDRRIAVLFTNITARKHAEEQLRLSQRQTKQARDYAEATLRTSPVPLLVLERDLRVKTANEAFYHSFQVEPAETEGRLVYELGNGQWNIPRLRELLEEILPKQTLFRQFEVTHEFQNIGSRTMLLNARRMENEPGAPERIVLVIDDITERKQSEEAGARLAAIVEFSDDAIISKDLNGVIMTWNDGAKALFGYTAQEAIGRPVTILMPPERVDEEPGILERIRRGESIQHYETVRRRKDGELLDISLTVSPLRDSHGRITGASKVARDISERRRAESLLEAEKKVLELIATGAPLPHVLETLVREVEANSNEGMLCSVLLADEAGERLLHGAAPSLPEAYNHAIHGIRIGPNVGSCGTAACRREPVFVTDIATDPLWADFKDLAAKHGLGACCSTPIISSAGKLLGTLAMYYRQPHTPREHDRRLVERATQLAAIVIERTRADEALRWSEESLRKKSQQLDAAMGASETGTFRWNPQTGEFLEFDDNRKRLFGKEPDTQFKVAEDFIKLVHPEDLPNLIPAIEACRHGADFSMEYRVILEDGSIRWLYDRARMEWVDGKPAYLVGACTDITRRKQAEEALKRTEKLAAVGRMAATMAHEVNNPLESVTNLLYLAKKDREMGAHTRQNLVLAEQELDRVAHITRQTLGFYRDSAAPALVDVSQTINDLLEVYGYRFRNREISLEKELDASAKIVTSAGELRQVFSNLFINAVDATPAGGRIRIRVRASRDWNGSGRTGVRFTVADTGCGIDPAHRSRIFDAFYTTKQEIGTGLGLWLSHSIVQKHGGHIQVRSRTQSGKSGTAFSVFWPDQSGAENLTLGETA